MSCCRRARLYAAALLLLLGMSGCLPGGDSQANDEKEPHFLMGRKLASQLDYDGAIDAYEQALLVNPESASAHFELAWLYEKKDDPAAAIYHYQRYLKLAPGSGKADIAREHINNCKLDLAKSASAIAPISAAAQKDLENMVEENRQLKAKVAAWEAYYAAHPPPPPTNNTLPATTTPSNGPGGTTAAAPSETVNHANGGSDSTANPVPAGPATRPLAHAGRTHTISPGDTLASIARKYSVSLQALQAANPQVEPRHLRVGAAVNIPGT
jgi:LysM repeat protein